MNSRETILAALKKNQPATSPLPKLNFAGDTSIDLKEQFIKTLTGIGGSIMEVNEWNDVVQHIKLSFPEASRIVNAITDQSSEFEMLNIKSDPHDFSNVTVAILKGEFGVAENGAIWLTDTNMTIRALPYICMHLVLILNKEAIVPNLHEAYDRIETTQYQLGTFLAGPSKTADIEQSLVLGAHGPKSLTVYLSSFL